LKFEIQRTVGSSFFLGKENQNERTSGSWYFESSKQTSGFHLRTSKEPYFPGQFFLYFFGYFWTMAGIYVYTTEPSSLIFLSSVKMKEISVLMHFHAFHVLSFAFKHSIIHS